MFDWKICSLSQFLPSYMYLCRGMGAGGWVWAAGCWPDEFNKYIDELKKFRTVLCMFCYVLFGCVCVCGFYCFCSGLEILIGNFQYLWIFLECNYLCNGFMFSRFRCQVIYYFTVFCFKLRYFFVMIFKTTKSSRKLKT